MATNTIWAPNYGSCTWDSTHDVGACINAAITEAHALGGRTVMVPAGLYGVSTNISQPWSGVHLVGAGVGIPRDTTTPGNYLAVTRLLWIGAADAEMFTEFAGGTSTIYSGDVTGIVFDCGSLAATCAHFTNVAWSTINIGGAEARKTNIWLDTAGGGGTEGPGNQRDDIWFDSRSTSGTYSPTGILIDAGVGSNWNTSFSRFHQLTAWTSLGDGVVFGNADNNVIYDVSVGGNVAVGRPLVFASSGYTMPNGNSVGGRAYDNIVLHASTIIQGQGFVSGSTITQGVHVGSAAVTTVPLTTNAQTTGQSDTLNFAATTNVLAGMAVNCGGTNAGVVTNSQVRSVGGTTVRLNQGTVGTVASSTVCTFSWGVTSSAVTGTYTLTAVDGTHWSITAPAGGHSQSNIAIASAAITFTDMVIPFTGTPSANDTFTVVVPFPSINNTISGLDEANSIPVPQIEPGATAFVGHTRAPLLMSYGGTGNLLIQPVLASNASVVIAGSFSGTPGTNAVILAGAGSLAGGFEASALGGRTNNASGAFSTSMGDTTLADGTTSFSAGAHSTSRTRQLVNCWGGGIFATLGDAQTCYGTLAGTIASASALRLTADLLTAGSTNCFNIPNNASYSLTVDIMAFDHTTVTKNSSWNGWTALLTRGANAASTAIVAGTTPTPLTNGTLTGQAIAMTADTTNGCLNISYTPPTGNTDTFNVVARVRSVEVQ